MNQGVLFLLVLSLWGIFILQPLLRSMRYAEPVLKMILSIVLGLGFALAGFARLDLPVLVSVIALILTPIFILGPVVLNALTRAKHHNLARALSQSLYWTEDGRKAIKVFLARAALSRADAEGALELLPIQHPLRIRALALQQKWDEVLSMPVSESVEASSARIEALITKGFLGEAQTELQQLRQLWEKHQTPEGYRILMLSETRLEAERGQLANVQKKVQTSLSGTPNHVLFGLLARAAEIAFQRDPAKQLYTQAYLSAPESQRHLYASKLQEMGETLPEIQVPKTTYGSFALVLTIVGAFLVQLWLENRYDQSIPRAIAAYLLNFPEIPESSAKWRFLSYAFVHGGLAHIAFNTWALFDLGRLYESRRNWANLLTAFIFGAVMGAYFTLVVQGNQQIVLVGASGGICGIAGALLADSLRGKTVQDYFLTRSLLQWIVFISAFGLIIPNVSFWGHTGGIIGGMLWGFIRQGLPTYKQIDWFVGGLSIGLIAYTFVSVVSYFLRYT